MKFEGEERKGEIRSRKSEVRRVGGRRKSKDSAGVSGFVSFPGWVKWRRAYRMLR